MRAALVPQPFALLLARARAELERQRSIFDLPRRSFWTPSPGLDFSVAHHGERAANPAGPAAGPHTQLAQNLAIAWLAGARVLELKTVQVKDRLEIPRPCIDAPNVGFNVEWSQELRLEESLEQYVSGWYLIHILAARGMAGSPGAGPEALFDASVGYDLAGITSAPVARFLDGLRDAGAMVRKLRDSLPPALRAVADVPVPARVASCVTLSTFHGCPPEEIERIVEHLFAHHGVHVVVKLNPTLLGYEAVEDLLRGQLGYDEIQLDPAAFEKDMRWEAALEMLERLAGAAARAGLTLGAKLTNTLVVRNHRNVLPGEIMYLSGTPLHVLAVTLADRLARATAGRIPMAFSAGIEAENFADAVACGFLPVTACTDLLKPTGYRRLPRYLKVLEDEMERTGARDVAGYVLARAGRPAGAGPGGAEAVREAALANLAAYAAKLPEELRYHAAQNREMPQRDDRPLELFDCSSCNACVVVCPNDAVFSLRTGIPDLETWELVQSGGEVHPRPSHFTLQGEEQWALFADFCNQCGNCDSFCPEFGGPQNMKPRFFGSRASFEAAAPEDGMLLEEGGARVLARFGGLLHTLESAEDGARFGDGVILAELDSAHRLVRTTVVKQSEGHVLPLWRYHALRVLRDGALAQVNWVSAGWLP